MVAALKRVQSGDLDVAVAVNSADEVGVLADGVNAMVETLRDRERILQTFGRVVEPSVRDRLLAGGVGATGELRTASILFCDLRGFTAMAEAGAGDRGGGEPERVLHGDDGVGARVRGSSTSSSGMRCWWCSGSSMRRAAERRRHRCDRRRRRCNDGSADGGAAAAVRCALGMHQRLAELNATRARRDQAPLGVSIGIHCGDVLAGTIGAADRHEYTVIGDAVNVAARLQQLCKDEGQRLWCPTPPTDARARPAARSSSRAASRSPCAAAASRSASCSWGSSAKCDSRAYSSYDGYHRETRAAEGSPAGPTEPERCDRRVAYDRRSWIDRRLAAANGTHQVTDSARTKLAAAL